MNIKGNLYSNKATWPYPMTYDLEKPAIRPRFCLLLEDLQARYIYDPGHDLPFWIWKLSYNESKRPKFSLNVTSIGLVIEGQGSKMELDEDIPIYTHTHNLKVPSKILLCLLMFKGQPQPWDEGFAWLLRRYICILLSNARRMWLKRGFVHTGTYIFCMWRYYAITCSYSVESSKQSAVFF